MVLLSIGHRTVSAQSNRMRSMHQTRHVVTAASLSIEPMLRALKTKPVAPPAVTHWCTAKPASGRRERAHRRAAGTCWHSIYHCHGEDQMTGNGVEPALGAT